MLRRVLTPAAVLALLLAAVPAAAEGACVVRQATAQLLVQLCDADGDGTPDNGGLTALVSAPAQTVAIAVLHCSAPGTAPACATTSPSSARRGAAWASPVCS